MTKFCSDPQCVLPERARTRDVHILHRSVCLKQCAIPGADKSAETPTLSTEARTSHSICQGERWERVDCKLKQRRVVLQSYSYTSDAARVLLQLASDMSHCPSMLNRTTKALQRAFISSHDQANQRRNAWLRVFYSPATVQAKQGTKAPLRSVKNYKALALNVSQVLRLPDCKPLLNQAMRCLLEPWVKVSGCA